MTSVYRPTIGLEIHAELKTLTKMFCPCKNDPDEKRPNYNVCPICMGHPGTLPTINAKAVQHVLMVGHAVGGTIADYTEFDRKNYFYPDIPKGYQLSQYAYPLVRGGMLDGVGLTRIHLEEDTARSTHGEGEGSLIDFNRSSVPLMELVTEPVIHSAEEASHFARELQLLLQYLGVAEANMEKGEMRVEANISVSKTDTFGTKVEVKNLNSFRSAERAIEYEIERHIALLEKGERIIQETRGFDEQTGKTFSQRVKEDSHDYRYFPDPDLPKVYISNIPALQADVLKAAMKETPEKKRIRYAHDYGIKAQDIEFYISNMLWGQYFESAAEAAREAGYNDFQLISNYIVSDIAGIARNADLSIEHVRTVLPGSSLVESVTLYNAGTLSSRGLKDLIGVLLTQGGNPLEVATANGFVQKNDAGEIENIVDGIIQVQPAVVAEYKAGKAASLQFLIGQGMKASKGSANPQLLKDLFIRKLS